MGRKICIVIMEQQIGLSSAIFLEPVEFNETYQRKHSFFLLSHRISSNYCFKILFTVKQPPPLVLYIVDTRRRLYIKRMTWQYIYFPAFNELLYPGTWYIHN